MAPPTVKIKHLTRNPGNTRFPKLDECAHFHYENVELGPITVQLCENQSDPTKPQHLASANKENESDCLSFLVTVTSNERKWVVRRTYRNFVFLDTQLHRCVYDRKYSLLQELPSAAPVNLEDENSENTVKSLLSEYLERFSQLAGSLINCGPVLNWLELDNRGNRLIVTDEVAINTPAVAAAYVVMRYTAQAADEISFDVGDMVSVIDMPPPDESTWWRGKKGYEVGFFPSERVEVIGDKVPHSFKVSSTASTKPVFRKHGKLIAFFRSFLVSRPSRRKLKQSGILKERVFGCDLGEHLLNTGREIPLVLKCCTEFIEEYGIVDGIYRLSGVNSNIQRLRLAFDEDRATNLGDPSVAQDVHSVASLLKMYFRELPNPLLTYQLYDKFVSAVQSEEEVRLLKIRDVVQQLPPPHYRTLQFLLDHLARIASHGNQTGMTPKNIAIVWAPNLLRSKEVENGGVGALHVVGVQAVLTEYLIRYAELIFDEKMPICPSGTQEESTSLRARPKSLAISTPTKLLSLEEARARALSTHLPLTQQKYIEVGGGPEKLPSKYHTVIDLPAGKLSCTKLKKSPSGWKSFFSRGWYSGSARDKSRPRNSRKASTASLPHTSMHMQEKNETDGDASYSGYSKKLRTVKSAESLIHCLKEAGHIIMEDEKLSNSPKTPQPVSMDSSYCFDTPCSVFPRSPSLQRHTRSSSHESYFENSSDMAVEDDSSIYYFVKEQMQKLQQEAESSLWTTVDDCKRKEPNEMDSYSKYTDSSETDVTGLGLSVVQGPIDHYDSEKVIRKQKFCAIDGDPAVAKVQRLSWMNSEGSSDKVCLQRDNEDRNIVSSSDLHSAKDAENQSSFVLTEESDVFSSSSVLTENFPWLQPSQPLSHVCKLVDQPSAYDSDLSDLLDKRYSFMSSSDNEVDSSSKVVVERYGNAETVLVEVHATQDSSSETESILDEGCDEVSKNYEVLDRSMEETITHSYPQESSSTCEYKGSDVNDDCWDESFKDGLSDIPCSTMILTMSVSHSADKADDNFDRGTTVESMDEDELTGEEKESSVDSDSVQDVPSKHLSVSSVACEDLTISKETLPESDRTANSSVGLEFIDNSESLTSDPDVFPVSAESLSKVHQESTAPEEKPKKSIYVKLKDDEVSCTENEITQKDKHLSDNIEISSARAKSASCETVTKALPSAVCRPERSSISEIHSLRTKIETIPLHRKRQILNIPTPSSPVEEVRKKFELRATSQKKNTIHEQPLSDNKLQMNSKEFPAKLNRRHTEVFEVQHSATETPENIKRKSDGILSAKAETVPNKRHSEPLSTSSKNIAGRVNSSLLSYSQTTPYPQKVSENKNLSDSSSVKSKPSLPSLYTQMKVRKLQSLQGESPTRVDVDPWSDPILDVQDDYHPVVCFPELAKSNELSVPEIQPDSATVSENVDSSLLYLSQNEAISNAAGPEEGFEMMNSSDLSENISLKDQEEKSIQARNFQEQNSSEMSKTETHEKNKTTSEAEVKTMATKDCGEDEAIRRERINRIKEERRAQLREKLKPQSFRLEAEEKEKIQTKFRFRKDHTRQTVAACMFDSSECLSGELKDPIKCEDTCETEKSSVVSESFVGEIENTGDSPKGCEIKPDEYSVGQSNTFSTCDKKAKSSAGNKGTENVFGSQSNNGETVLVPKKLAKSDNTFGVSGSVDLNSTKRTPGISVPLAVSPVRESNYGSLDVKDRVAMFERTKDKELCRVGPNGKFPQKQSASSLVR